MKKTTHGKYYRQTTLPKRLRRGSRQQPTKADEPTDSGENTRPIQPIPGGEQAHLEVSHKANSADEAACSTENSRSSQPIPGGERTDLETTPESNFQH
jgi:hypothetical protein